MKIPEKINKFYLVSAVIFAVLLLLRVTVITPNSPKKDDTPKSDVGPVKHVESAPLPAADGEWADATPGNVADGVRKPHPIKGVRDFNESFPDVQDVQILAALENGITPCANREELQQQMANLIYIGSSPYYHVDEGMTSSVPYLVPKAAELLNSIGRNFYDSLYVKGVPLRKLIVSSVLRTDDDVAELQKSNINSTTQSCHCFGTTFDLRYRRFYTIPTTGGKGRVEESDDTLKFVLCEVLRDLREQGLCYVKYEVKQGCMHITVR